jgi:hypothetical protein
MGRKSFAGRGMYQEGARVSEQFARSENMFHATCYYNPISYSPLNLKRHYFSLSLLAG